MGSDQKIAFTASIELTDQARDVTWPHVHSDRLKAGDVKHRGFRIHVELLYRFKSF